MTANSKQIGGTHYKSEYQHWDFVQSTRLGYLEGCATKYITRAFKKNGPEDCQKAIHYVEKLIEQVRDHKYKPPGWGWWHRNFGHMEYALRRECSAFFRANPDLTPVQQEAFRRVVLWACWDEPFQPSHPEEVLAGAIDDLRELLWEADHRLKPVPSSTFMQQPKAAAGPARVKQAPPPKR